MNLHGDPVIETGRLPDGQTVWIRVGMAEDSYIADRDVTMVVLELRVDGEVAAFVETLLDPSQTNAARDLAARVLEGLSSGAVEPTAAALERLVEERSSS